MLAVRFFGAVAGGLVETSRDISATINRNASLQHQDVADLFYSLLHVSSSVAPLLLERVDLFGGPAR